MRALRGVIVVVIAIGLPAAVLVAVLQASLEVYNRDDATALQASLEVYKRGDDAMALENLRALAEQHGDSDVQFRLGIMYAKGTGVPQDYAEAAK